jgi:hypothetical protein
MRFKEKLTQAIDLSGLGTGIKVFEIGEVINLKTKRKKFRE